MGHGKGGRRLRPEETLGRLEPALVFVHSPVDSSLCGFVLMAQDKIQSFQVAGADTFGFDTFAASRSCFIALININKGILERQKTEASRIRLTFT